MATITQEELRDNVGDVLRRAEAGEEITVTVAGRTVARLGPVRVRQWVRGPDLQRVWQTPAPQTLRDDLAAYPATVTDPFEP